MQDTNQSETARQAIDYWQILKNRYGVLLLTFLLVFLTAAVITYVMPKKYESIALVEVKQIVDIDPTMGGVKGGMGAQMSRQFINTQFEIIVAPETLGLAIDKIQLEARWGEDRKSVLAQLKGIVRTSQRRSCRACGAGPGTGTRRPGKHRRPWPGRVHHRRCRRRGQARVGGPWRPALRRLKLGCTLRNGGGRSWTRRPSRRTGGSHRTCRSARAPGPSRRRSRPVAMIN